MKSLRSEEEKLSLQEDLQAHITKMEKYVKFLILMFSGGRGEEGYGYTCMYSVQN